MIYVLALLTALFVVALAARVGWCTRSARRALLKHDSTDSQWRIACGLSTLVMPSAVSIVLTLLIGASLDGALSDDRWAIALAVATGVLGNHIDRAMSSGWEPYWTQVHKSLREALPRFIETQHVTHADRDPDDCQATRFNGSRYLLFDPLSDRKALLRIIFSKDPHPTAS